MNSKLFGIAPDADPKSVDLNAMGLNSFDKGLLSKGGFDIARKFTKKQRKGFPYEALASDSQYFAAYKEFLNCVDETTAGREASFSTAEMEAACGQQFKRLRILAVSGELKYYNINAPYFQPMMDAVNLER